MVDQIVQTSSRGLGSRLIESIKGVLVGLVLFVVAFPVLWWNEGRAVQTYESLTEGAGAVVSVPSDAVDASKEGALVHTTGRAETTETLKDPEFGISAQALRLSRKVEMYQWEEESKSETKKKLGGGEETVTTYTYDTGWSDDLIDSSAFQQSEGHENPKAMPYESATQRPEKVTLGAFVLPADLQESIGGDQPITVTEAMLSGAAPAAAAEPVAAPPSEEAAPHPATKAKKGKKAKAAKAKSKGKAAKVAATPAPSTPAAGGGRAYKIVDGSLYFGADPATPKVGDVRITFSRIDPTDVTVVAAQVGGSFGAFQTKAGDALSMLKTGTHTAPEMFSMAQAENTMLTWILRAVGFLLMLFGVNMVFRPLAVVADIVPFIGDVLRMGTFVLSLAVAAPSTLITIALAWVFYRPVMGIALLVTGVAAVVGVKMLASKRKAAAQPSAVASA